MSKKVAIFYYSQTGQGLEAARAICQPIEHAGHTLMYKEIVPTQAFPYPWSASQFFQAFPESREGIACSLEPICFDDVADADLVVVVYPAWYLSPSIPTHAFFQLPKTQQYLSGKPVVTIDACRNMWVMAHKKVKQYVANASGKLVGHIVLQDRHPNLISVITIVRWLLGGKKEKSGMFPRAGVSEKDITEASRFGDAITNSLQAADYTNLQNELMAMDAIKYKPSIVFIEKTGHRIFGIWSKFILKKGGYGAPERAFRLSCFKYYLFAILYLLSPIGLTVFYLTYPLRLYAIKKDKRRQCYDLSKL